MKDAGYWIEKLKLERHPEGGWYRRVYESDLKSDEGRPLLTSIYYLLSSDDFSALHRLGQDEQWHFYAGSPLTVHEIDLLGVYTAHILGVDQFQYTVKAGHLFGATVEDGYALVGCAVVPGFDFADFEMPARSELLNKYPYCKDLINTLTR